MSDSFSFIGHTDFRNQQRPFGIKHSDRRLHVHVLGKTGTGKSTLLKNLIIQDLRNGSGVCVIDPHGDLVTSLLDFIPSHRTWQAVYFDPADQDFPMGLNILESVDPSRRPLVTEHVISVFKNIWKDSWGPRMEHILRNAVLTLLELEGATLLWIPRLLSDSPFRQSVIPRVRDPLVKNFWLQEYERYSPAFQKEAIAPIQNKVGAFLTSVPIRHIVGQVKSSIDLGFMMDHERILLANLAKGRLGEEAVKLLGSLLVTKLFVAALGRVSQPEEERKDFYLYIDEAHTLATDIFASVLSEARKYRLNLTLSHQYLDQLDRDIKQSILGNVGTLICFRVGAPDAQELQLEFAPEFAAGDLESLGPFQIYLKLAVDGMTSRPFSARTLAPAKPQTNEGNRESVIKSSRQKYGTRRSFIEEKISRWLAKSETSSLPPERRSLRKGRTRARGMRDRAPTRRQGGSTGQ